MISRKKIIQYIVILIGIKILGFSLFFLYSSSNKIDSEAEVKEQKKLVIHHVKEINTEVPPMLSKEERIKEKNKAMHWILQEKMKKVYATAVGSYDKKKSKKENIIALKEGLNNFEELNIFVANYYENTLYGSNNYKDIDARTIVLEEIQKVRRRGEGFIVSSIDEKGLVRYVLVKDLNFLDLYIGINIIE